MRRVLLICSLILFITTPAFSETTIKAQTDKTSITSDDNITYKLTIVSSDKNIPVPEGPGFEGFNIVSEAQSSQISLAGGKVKSVIVYAYILSPQKIGKIRIEPAKIKLKNETLSTASIDIEIKPGTRPIPSPEQNQPESQNGLPESQEPQITL